MNISPWRDNGDPDPSWMHEIKVHTIVQGLRLAVWTCWLVIMIAVGLNALYHPTTDTTRRPSLLPCGVLHLKAGAESPCKSGIQGFLEPFYYVSP